MTKKQRLLSNIAAISAIIYVVYTIIINHLLTK